jgi:SM-20-related protein
MSFIDLDAIRAAEMQRDPFDFLVVPGAIPRTALADINRDYPRIESPGNLSLEDLEVAGNFEALVAELESPQFAAVVGEQFDLDLAGCPTTITVRKFCEKSDGNIHTDHRSKVVTVLFYFNEDWSGDAGRLRMLRSPTDIEDYAAEVPPNGGTMLAFRRTDHSWHGHKTFIGERRMLQLSFLRSGRLARWRQQVDRMGTRTMKRALRVISPDS